MRAQRDGWAAVEAVVRAHQAELVATLGPSARAAGLDPEDAVQAALIQLHTVYRDLLDIDNPVALCVRIGRNYIADHARSGFGRFEQPHPNPRELLTGHSTDVASQVIATADYNARLARLPLRDRQAARLLELGYTRRQVATTLGLSASGMQRLVRRLGHRVRHPRMGAALAAVAYRLRRLTSGEAPTVAGPATLVASITAFSLVAGLTTSGTARATSSSPPATRRDSPPITPGAPPAAPGTGRPTPGPAPRAAGQSPAPARRAASDPARLAAIPQPSRCVAKSKVCVNDTTKPGDHYYVILLGEHPGASQDVIETCDHVPTNPALGCRHTGKPDVPLAGPPPTPGASPWAES